MSQQTHDDNLTPIKQAEVQNTKKPTQIVPGCGCCLLYASIGLCFLLLWLLPKFGFQDQEQLSALICGVFFFGCLLGIFLEYYLGWLAEKVQRQPSDGSLWHSFLEILPISDDIDRWD